MTPSVNLTSVYVLRTIKLLSVRNLTRISKKFYYRGGNLKTMKLESPAFQSILTSELNTLVNIFDKYDHELRIAGGAVRDLVLDMVPHDIDFATTATPTQMKEMFNIEKIRMINDSGEKHGTITARINDKENFEVTTLRIDVVTDGRRAEVEFTRDWQLDANRRDLTINAMFLGFDGTIYDYFNGVEDLKNRRVKFVGDPVSRIQEDYLRILRYFRFYGRISEKGNDHEESTLNAIKENASGMKIISGERIWMELKKILCGNHARDILPTMLQLDLAPYMGLPDKTDIEEYRTVCCATEGLDPQPMTRLVALLANDDEVHLLHKRIKLSRDELQLGSFIVNHRKDSFDNDPMTYCQFLFTDSPGEMKKLTERICELLKYRGEKDLMDQFMKWESPKFPVNGYDLVDRQIPKGPIFQGTLHELKQIWKFSMFTKTKEELLENLDEIVEKVTEKVPSKKRK
ncbi:CCA tRNA nucleotidyltransferase 1, mitochondrial-like [Mytilus galloprovincialis]|uniref:CCA tRNA nucleotidyltransferase 1, mitochondrial-like n=1 Tax=Mytilus galloprovincialis TaxID=29158 RepID=UPI003F7B96C7